MFRIRHGTLIDLFSTKRAFTTSCYTNPRSPYLTLPSLFNGYNFWPTLYITITTTTTTTIIRQVILAPIRL